jgi:bifunctional non-homologous end joining protein LigD
MEGQTQGRATASSDGGSVEVEGVRLTHPHKVLFPQQGLTKGALAAHYQRAGGLMLPHVIDRPLTLFRCPEGADGTCFFQKHAAAHMPEVLERVRVEEARGPAMYVAVSNLAGLIALVQMGVLEIHVGGARKDRPDRPDRMVLDLDPGPGVSFERVIEAARLLRDWLARVDLQSFVMTTGGKGLHVVLPLERRHGYDEVLTFAQAIARAAERTDPRRFVAKAAKDARVGRIFVDYLRNGRGATAIAPYSTRARTGAPVAVPLRWSEVGAGLQPDGYRVDNLDQRLSRLRSDPWKGYAELKQRLRASALRAIASK